MALEQALPFFKALADETRLRIVGLLATRELSVDELAALLRVRPPTVSHHLQKLRELDLVSMRPDKNTHFYALKTDVLRSLSRDVFNVERYAEDIDADGWHRKVLRDFLDHDQHLKEIPASHKKRSVILQWLSEKFEPARRYTEREVNAVLQQHHEDAATLRRELVGAHLLQRENSVYWRPD